MILYVRCDSSAFTSKSSSSTSTSTTSTFLLKKRTQCRTILPTLRLSRIYTNSCSLLHCLGLHLVRTYHACDVQSSSQCKVTGHRTQDAGWGDAFFTSGYNIKGRLLPQKVYVRVRTACPSNPIYRFDANLSELTAHPVTR